MHEKERMFPPFPQPAEQQALLPGENVISGLLPHSTVEDIIWPQQDGLD